MAHKMCSFHSTHDTRHARRDLTHKQRSPYGPFSEDIPGKHHKPFQSAYPQTPPFHSKQHVLHVPPPDRYPASDIPLRPDAPHTKSSLLVHLPSPDSTHKAL